MEVFPEFEYDHWGPSEGNTTLQRVSTPLHTSLNLSTPLHTSSHLLTPLHNSHLFTSLPWVPLYIWLLPWHIGMKHWRAWEPNGQPFCLHTKHLSEKLNCWNFAHGSDFELWLGPWGPQEAPPWTLKGPPRPPMHHDWEFSNPRSCSRKLP